MKHFCILAFLMLSLMVATIKVFDPGKSNLVIHTDGKFTIVVYPTVQQAKMHSVEILRTNKTARLEGKVLSYYLQ